jgi:hypothetical protein
MDVAKLIRPNKQRTVSPKQSDGALAIAKLSGNAYDGSTLKRAARVQGFKALGNDRYLHSDGSWAALNSSGYVVYGHQSTVFDSQPSKLTSLTMHRGAVSASLAVSNVASKLRGGRDAMVAQLKRAGFSEVVPGYYSHAEGSWVALAGTQKTFGLGAMRVNPKRVAAPTKSLRRFRAKPSSSWGWYKSNTALGKLPIIRGDEETIGLLLARGFKKASKGGRARYVHPDGSWVSLSLNDGNVRLGWQKWPLGRLPFNNRTSP